VSWILINLTNYREEVVNILSTRYESLEYVKDLFRYSDENLFNHSLWLIGNLCADKPQNREYFARSGILDQMGSMLNDFITTNEIKEKIVWTICNMTRGKISNFVNEFMPIAQPILKYLSNSTEDKELGQALYVIFKLTSTYGIILNEFISPYALKVISELLTRSTKTNKLYAVKIIANLNSGNDIQTQLLINEGIIEIYKGLIQEDDLKLIKEVIWGISNIAGGTVSQIEKLIINGIIKSVIEIADYLIGKHEDQDFYIVK
jgi:importin subunit alpha-1